MFPRPGDDGSRRSGHSEYVQRNAQRLDDWGLSYHVRPVVIAVGGRRVLVDPQEAQLLLVELGRLPASRHRAAEETATDIVGALAAGYVVELGDEHRRCLLRAIEGVRAARPVPRGLAGLRDLLLHTPEPVL